MQIFEFQFNTKKDNQKNETLLYQSKDKKRSLYFIGEIRNIISRDKKLLVGLLKIIKDEYILQRSTLSNRLFNESVLRINKFLSGEILKDNVAWLGNTNLAIIYIYKNKIKISKTGKIKTFIVGDSEIEEIGLKKGEELKNKNIQGRAFSAIISGKIEEGKRLVVITEEPLALFIKNKILDKVASLKIINNKNINKIINSLRKDSLKISGIFSIIDMAENGKEKRTRKRKSVDFSFRELLISTKKEISTILPRYKKVKDSKPRLLNLKMSNRRKRLFFLSSFLVVLLIVGYFSVGN